MGSGQTPRTTVFVMNDYFLIVDATSGQILSGIWT